MLKILSFAWVITIHAGCLHQAKQLENSFDIRTADEATLITRLAPYLPDSYQSQDQNDEKLLIEFILDRKWDVKRADMGYYYQILDPGEESQPKWGDRLRADYNVYLLNGQMIDSTYRTGRPFTFYLGNVIRGWNDALTQIGIGGKMVILLPSSLAYAEEGLSSMVPPNTCLIFEIELLEIIL